MALKKPEVQQKPDERPDALFGDQDFRWRVTEGGYHWDELNYVPFGPANQPEDRELLLTDRILFGQMHTSRPYLPSKEGELFRTFANLPPTDRDAIQSFANQYGMLGISVQAIYPPVEVGALENMFVETKTGSRPATAKDLRGLKRRPVGTGERYTDWQSEIRAMNRAVRLHTLLARDDRRELKKLVFRPNNRWVYEERGSYEGIENLLICSMLLESKDWLMPHDDERPAARLCLQRWINEHLDAHTAGRLVWDLKDSRHVFRFMPKNLLGALWLQLARLVIGEVTYRPCKACGKMLTISADSADGRVDRSFCNDTCRQRDHRRKVRQAEELHGQGKSARAIAKQIDASVDAVERWLKKRR